MKTFQVDMFAEADVAAEAAEGEVSNTASLANVEHHAHLTDNWDDAEGYYRVQVFFKTAISSGDEKMFIGLFADLQCLSNICT